MSEFWSEEETPWSFVLCGTAVGIGTLFLPIQLGSAGAVVLLIIALIAWPLTYWPHKALYQFILSSKTSAGEGTTNVATHYYGKEVGSLIATLCFITFLMVVLVCAVTITNSLIEQLAKHIAIDLRIHMLVSFGVVLALSLIFLVGRQATIRVMGFLVFPLIAYFLSLSLCLTEDWQPMLLTDRMPLDQCTPHRVWISIPVMASAFSHTPIISTFAIDRQEKYDEQTMGRCKKIVKVTYVIICLNVLLFVFSCLLLTPTNYIEDAKNESVTILSALSMMPNMPAWLSVSGIIVAVVATSRLFLGTYFDVIEGVAEIVEASLHQVGIKKNRAFNCALSIMPVSAITSIACCTNPDTISMIYAISGPLIAAILFIMPTSSTYLISALKPYRSMGNLVTLIIGPLYISVMLFGQSVLFNGSFQ